MTAHLQTFLAGMTRITADAAASSPALPVPVHRDEYIGWNIPIAPPPRNPADAATPEVRLERTQRSLFRALVLVGATTPEPGAGEPVSLPTINYWKTWISTLAHLVFRSPVSNPEVRRGIRPVEAGLAQRLYTLYYSVEDFVAAHATDIGNIDLNHADWTHIQMEVSDILGALRLPRLGTITALEPREMLTIGSTLQRASYYALVVYLCGRPVGTREMAITTRRPSNLQEKYNNGQQWSEIGGNWRMSRGTWRRVGRAWELDGLFRAAYFEPLVGLSRSVADPVSGAVGTMVVLLENAQLSHVKIITDFLKAYPWVSEMPELAYEIYMLASDTEVWLQHPPHIRPFAKLIYRDQFKALDGKVLDRLARLACDIMEQRQTDLQYYALRTADPTLRARFDAELRARAPAMAQAATAATIVPAGAAAPAVLGPLPPAPP